jgi:hypothetical protein
VPRLVAAAPSRPVIADRGAPLAIVPAPARTTAAGHVVVG